MNEKNKVEAILFASSNFMALDEISKLSGIADLEQLRLILSEIKIDYEARGSAVTLIEDNRNYKFTVKDHYAPLLQKLISKTELNKPLTETLAVIAWKYPVTQSEVIKIRHNKAYEHMRQLEKLSFISRIKFGRTSKIILTEKFFEYFSLPNKTSKEALKELAPQPIKEVVEKKEQEINEAETLIIELKEKEKEMEDQRRKIKEEEAKSEKIAETGENLEVSDEQLNSMEAKFDKKETKKEIPELETNADVGKFQESLLHKAKERRKRKKSVKIETKEKLKEELKELADKEEKEIEKIEQDLSELKKEEEADIYAEHKPESNPAPAMPELQKPDEVPEPNADTEKEE